MDKDTLVEAMQVADRVCTNMMISLETMYDIESAGFGDKKVLERLSFAMNVVLVLRNQLDEELEFVKFAEDD